MSSTRVQPSSNVQLRFEPTCSWRRGAAQYVQSVADTIFSATLGRRYIFAKLAPQSLALDTRIDWVFTPHLSLQAYIQPLPASGDFRDFKQLRAARTFQFDVFGRDTGTIRRGDSGFQVDPDGAGPAAAFNIAQQNYTIRSLRANVVLRWEYRPRLNAVRGLAAAPLDAAAQR